METERESYLCQRIADRDDRPADWDELSLLAERDNGVWDRLLLTLRDDAALRAATAPLLAIAERVELPARGLAAGPRRQAKLPWLLAAALGVTALLQFLWRDARTDRPTDTTQESIQLGELPRLLVRATPTADGNGLRVVSLRRILAEDFVTKAARLGIDEVGAPNAIPIELASLASMTDY